MSIELRQVSKRFGRVEALRGVSLKLDEGKIYGLLGNNGAGKTTLLSLITNRLYPDGGEIFVDDMPVSGNDKALGRLFMTGEQNLYPEDMRVRQAFKISALFYPSFDSEYAYELCRQFGLNPRMKITALSTGYASIFRLIVAMSVHTPYLLLDEPVLGLDASHRDMFYRLLIEKYSTQPCTIVLSTHLISEVENLVEHVVIIRDGEILAAMPKDELLCQGYTISGPAGLVDSYVTGKRVLTQKRLGGLKTACVQGTFDQMELPQGLELGSVSLQDYFISLMNEEETK